MIRTVDAVSTVVVLVLGVGHTALTPVFVPGLNQGSIWFAGGGLALLFLGFLNTARLVTPDAARLRQLCLAANGVALPWIVLVSVVVPGAPQPYIASVAILSVTVCAFRSAGKARRQAA